MKIQETIEFLTNLIEKTNKKWEINFYRSFIKMLESLSAKKLSEDKIKWIEIKLEELDLQSIQVKKHRDLKKKFLKLTTYLEVEFKLIQEGHYTSLGIVFGMIFGLVMARSFWLEFGMWNETTGGLILGMSLWSIIWYFLDKKAEKDNRVLKIK
jgi:hypothetical protein